jgi:hypothetical protein
MYLLSGVGVGAFWYVEHRNLATLNVSTHFPLPTIIDTCYVCSQILQRKLYKNFVTINLSTLDVSTIDKNKLSMVSTRQSPLPFIRDRCYDHKFWRKKIVIVFKNRLLFCFRATATDFKTAAIVFCRRNFNDIIDRPPPPLRCGCLYVGKCRDGRIVS